jgi:hypothetical protein
MFCGKVLKEKGKIMTGIPRFFCIVFLLFAIASAGHDVWRMKETGGDFAFSQVGGLITLYAKTEHNEARDVIAENIGAEGFNAVFVPLLKSYTVLLCLGLSALFGIWGFVSARRGRLADKGGRGMKFTR